MIAPWRRQRVQRVLRRGHGALLRRAAARTADRGFAALVEGASGHQAAALQQRMHELLRVVGHEAAAGAEPPAQLVPRVEQALTGAGRDVTWLALAVLTGRLPHGFEVVAAHRRLVLDGPGAALAPALAAVLSPLSPDRWRPVRVAVREGVVLADVHSTAGHDIQTGIQRVVRRTVPLWVRDHSLQLVAWTPSDDALRDLVPHEQERVLRWSGPLGDTPPGRAATVVVPWRSTLLLPEVPGLAQCGRLAGLAEHSGNRVSLLGYDCIPVLGAEFVPDLLPTLFARYLGVVKHADRVATISASAADEFGGIGRALAAQGLPGPHVQAVPLATEVPAAEVGESPAGDPVVLVVGSHEPRKNHLAVLHAAELLWREGLRFRLRLLGGRGFDTEPFEQRLADLEAAGRPVEVLRGPSDVQVWEAFRTARFSVFPSLYEGYGLPVVESLAFGTPVVATCYGSTGELEALGGTVPVDPRDDDALTDAVRRLLTDDDAVAALRAQALARPVRTWEEYAREAWAVLVP
ncbi:MAG: glycosyltransferase [Actinomycetes bacterium]